MSPNLLFVGVSALVFTSAVGILLVRAARHVGWWLSRKRDARGRKGDLLEALAQAAERSRMSPSPYLQDSDFTLYCGDSREVLSTLPAESVHMAVTSPPFFGLRNYGCEGQIGLESTPEEWVAQLVAVFEEVRRVLRKDGTLWVEVGDSYNTYPANRGGSTGLAADAAAEGARPRIPKGAGLSAAGGGRKPKDLIGQPFLLAFALREAGWYWRNVCIWHKPNPMPESVRDRFTVSHSYVLLFSKSPRYFFDAEAVREAHSPDGRKVTTRTVGNGSHENYQEFDHDEGRERWPNSGRNARSVWKIPTEPLPFEHYAAFPQALAERCIKAGTSERGCCPECGAPWAREVERELGEKTGGSMGQKIGPGMHREGSAADKIAHQEAQKLGFFVEPHPADWDLHGKRAGFFRNREMVRLGADLVIAFWDGRSKGTQHTMDLAREQGIPLEVVEALTPAMETD